MRYRVAFGGRGGAKSWNIARSGLSIGATSRIRWLCAREFQRSIRDSVHKLLSIQIDKMGLGSFYEIQNTRIIGRNGTEIIFHGLRHNVDQIKSLEDVDLCWIEEGATISRNSWEVLVPTIRNEGSEIWVSFNPEMETDWMYQLFIGADPPRSSIVRQVGWQDNPFLSSTLREEREESLRRDPETEAHIWGGSPWMRRDDQVMVKIVDGERLQLVRVDDFEANEENWDGPYFGADWGFSPDPTELVRSWIAGNTLYIDYEARGIGWVVSDIDREFRKIPGAAEHVIRADNARPEIIAQLRRDKLDEDGETIEAGLNVVAAKKWTGCVEDRIDHFRSYDEIVVHPRCRGIIQDTRLWRYKKDAAGNVLPKLVDGNDHGWDAEGYGLEQHVKQRPAWGVAN